MRYKDWDVLLFNQDCPVPLQEFKVTCQVVHDTESKTPHVSGVPAVTCFVPSLDPGTPFKLSIHSWKTPFIDQFINNGESPVIRARLFIDGVPVTSIFANQNFSWPCIISHTDQKQVIRFPIFQQELLCQRHWSAADDLGRIKLVISEGICHGSQGDMTFERVHNHVIFSFQHAPQDYLEHMEIAWPNASMWRRLQQSSTPSLTSSVSNPTDQTPMSQQSSTFSSQASLEHNTFSPATPTSFFGGLFANYPNDLMGATIWDTTISSLNQDTTPHMSTPEVQLCKSECDQLPAWPDSSMFSDTTLAMGHQPQQISQQQMYTPSNGSVPMLLDQPQAQGPSIYDSTELGQGTATENPAKFLFGSPTQNAPQTFHSDTAKRPAKRVRADTPGSAKSIRKENNGHRGLGSPFQFNPFGIQTT